MNVFVHNFNPVSNSGPNKFSRQLFNNLIRNHGVKIVNKQSEADVEFALIQLQSLNIKPLVMRLDGIYFNSEQDYQQQNSPIKSTYDRASIVVYQSQFNKELTESWFGSHKNGHVIHNAPDTEMLSSIEPMRLFEKDDMNDLDIWCCASSWRPHKRLEENLRYFYEKSSSDSLMIVAGKDPDFEIIEKYSKKTEGRVFYAGELDYKSLLSLYKKASTFIHLAYLDHCPNVVVDAQASGCHVICSSSGGTSEIVTDGTIIPEDTWNFEPIKLYDPPKMNFGNYYIVKKDKKLDLKETAKRYYDVLESAIRSESI